MDAVKVSVSILNIGVVSAALISAAGCRPQPSVGADSTARALRRAAREKRAGITQLPTTIVGTGNSFKIADNQGRPILEAKVEKVDGKVQMGKGLDGPVKFLKADCRLFKEGVRQLDLQAPEAVWDGVNLVAEKTAHAVTPDGNTIIDSQKATWTAASGNLDLETAKVQRLKGGKLEFTADGPKALVANQVVTMPAGGTGRNAAGQVMRADHVRWHTKTENVEARGNVVVTDAGTRASGQRLVANTQLKRGRLSGGARIQMGGGPALARGKRKRG